MARHFFVSDVLVRSAVSTVQLANGDQLTPLQLAAGQPFTLWTDRSGGDKVTDCTAPDGITPLPLTDGFFTADGTGQPPPFFGPNSDTTVVLWIDGGAGTRYPMYAADILARVLVAAIGWLAGTPGTSNPGGTDWTSLINVPTTFPPTSHTHPAGQIEDATATGRAVLKAADAQSARVAIGAGTGNGTSDLALGSSSTTAAPGNHSHKADALTFTPAVSLGLTATDVQTAIQQAAQSGGGSGVSAVYVWRYSAGGWPTLPTTKPAGVYEVRALGPSYPTNIPSWIGLGANQVPMSYSKVNVA